MLNQWNRRSCKNCGEPVIDVRDEFTGATYPVEAASTTGLHLLPAKDSRKNPIAVLGEFFMPHLPRCGLPKGPYIPVGMGDAPDPGTGFSEEGDDQEELEVEEEEPGP